MSAEPPLRRLLQASWWLIEKDGHGPMEVLTVDHGGEKVLPVFSFEEEAEIFCSLGPWREGWRVRESAAGELASVLYGPCAGVGSVALDPLPEMVAEKTVGLVSLTRERFLDRIMHREKPFRPDWISCGRGVIKAKGVRRFVPSLPT